MVSVLPSPPWGYLAGKSFVLLSLRGLGGCKIFHLKSLLAKYWK
jgi:hypothetical protein